MRCVSVLRASYRSLVTVAVCSRSPLPTLNRLVSGLWFHSHRGPSVGPGERVPADHRARPSCVVVMVGRLYVAAPAAVDGLHRGPAVGAPADRRQRRHPAAGVGVGEGHVPPVAGLRLDDAALVRHPAAGDRAGQVEQHLAHLVRAERRRRPQHVLAVRRPGQPDVVVAVALVEPGALERADARRRLEHLLRAHLRGAVGVELRDADRAVAVGDVHRVVVVDQQAGVVVAAVDPRLLGPRAVDGGRRCRRTCG